MKEVCEYIVTNSIVCIMAYSACKCNTVCLSDVASPGLFFSGRLAGWCRPVGRAAGLVFFGQSANSMLICRDLALPANHF